MAWWDGTPLAQSHCRAPLLTLQCVAEHNKAKEGFILPYLCSFPARYGQCDDNTYTKQSILEKKKKKNIALQLELWGISIFITPLLYIHILYQGW